MTTMETDAPRTPASDGERVTEIEALVKDARFAMRRPFSLDSAEAVEKALTAFLADRVKLLKRIAELEAKGVA